MPKSKDARRKTANLIDNQMPNGQQNPNSEKITFVDSSLLNIAVLHDNGEWFRPLLRVLTDQDGRVAGYHLGINEKSPSDSFQLPAASE